MNLSVEITNFKKNKDVKHEFEGGNIYIIGGPNDVGKSTFLQALEILSTGVDTVKGNKVAHGETEGSIKGIFNIDGANGGRYVVKYDFNNEKGKFTLIDPDTKVLKSTSKNNVIADIFKYNKFTIDEFFAWGLTAEGRRKQGDILLSLLPKEAKEEYLLIESKVNNRNGVDYLARTEKQRQYDTESAILQTLKVTEEQEKLIKQLPAITKEVESLKTQIETALSSSKSQIEEKIASTKELSNSLIDANIAIEDEIAELEKQIKRKKELFEANSVKIKEYNTTIQSLEKELTDCPVVDIEALRARLKTGEDYQRNAINYVENKEKYVNKQKEVQTLFDELEKMNISIEKNRARKKEILSTNKIAIKGITIDDGEAMYVDKDGNTMPFIKDSVSYSEGGMIIFEIMSIINKTLPIWLVGSAESYDNKRIEKFQELAEKNNGIIFMDKVIPDNEELTINILEK